MVGAGVGAGLGADVGAELGTNVGEGLGKAVGDGDGKKLGAGVVGKDVGTGVGKGLGTGVGAGDTVGAGVGTDVGVSVGGDVLLGQLAMLSTCSTPHDVDAHRVYLNALYRSTPFNTHQSLRSWLKAEASLNMFLMLPTPEVSHAPMSSLKDDLSRNNSPMSVTLPVFHAEMWPYVTSAAAASANHAATAVLIFQLTMTLPVRGTLQSLWSAT